MSAVLLMGFVALIIFACFSSIKKTLAWEVPILVPKWICCLDELRWLFWKCIMNPCACSNCTVVMMSLIDVFTSWSLIRMSSKEGKAWMSSQNRRPMGKKKDQTENPCIDKTGSHRRISGTVWKTNGWAHARKLLWSLRKSSSHSVEILENRL